MIKAILKLMEIESKLFLREPAAFIFTLCFPLMLLFIFGAIFNSPTGYIDITIDQYIPCLISMIIAAIGLMCLPITIVEYKEQGIFRQYKTTPLPLIVLLIVEVVVSFIMALFGVILLLIFSKIFYKINFLGSFLNIGLSFILSCISFLSLGFMIGGLVKRAREVQVIGMALFFPMLFLSGSAIHKELFPEFLKRISTFIPLTHVVDLLQGVWIGKSLGEYIISEIVLLGIFLLSIIISLLYFRWE